MKKLLIVFFLLLTYGVCSDFKTVSKIYFDEVSQYEKAEEDEAKQASLNKMVEQAKSLLGVADKPNFSVFEYVDKFCKKLEKKVEDLEKNKDSEDEKASLKAKRDIENYNEISKFLIVGARLVDFLCTNPNAVEDLVKKCKYDIPYLANEIIKVLQSSKIIVTSPDDLENVIQQMKEFAFSGGDGTHLLSVLFSVSMEQTDKLDFSEIIKVTDFENKELCRYLKVR